VFIHEADQRFIEEILWRGGKIQDKGIVNRNNCVYRSDKGRTPTAEKIDPRGTV
jgi:hypothetical protein